MAFIVGAVVAGGGILIASHDKYERYREYHHTQHTKYNDSEIRNQISNKENQVRSKDSDVENLRRRMNDNFNSRINELKREKNYSALNSPPSDIVYRVKDEMRTELNSEISHDKQELEAIDKMIARINEIELQAKRE